MDTVFVLRKPPIGIRDERTAPLNERLIEHVQNLVDAGLTVSDGDRRCIRHGLLAESALRVLAPAWNLAAPIEERMEAALRARGDLPCVDLVDDQRFAPSGRLLDGQSLFRYGLVREAADDRLTARALTFLRGGISLPAGCQEYLQAGVCGRSRWAACAQAAVTP